MNPLTIKTNHQFRQILDWYELTEKEQLEFDYIEGGSGSFVRYKNWTYDLGEFMSTDRDIHMGHEISPIKAWHGYQSDSFFSGVLVTYSDDYETVKLATYYC